MATLGERLRGALQGAAIGSAIGRKDTATLNLLKDQMKEQAEEKKSELKLKQAEQKLELRQKELKENNLLYNSIEAASVGAKKLEDEQGIQTKVEFDKDLGSFVLKPQKFIQTQTGRLESISQKFGIKEKGEKDIQDIRERVASGQSIAPAMGGVVVGRGESTQGSTQEALKRLPGIANKKLKDLNLNEQIEFVNEGLKDQGFEIDMSKDEIGIKAFGENIGIEDLSRIGRAFEQVQEQLGSFDLSNEERTSLEKLKKILLSKIDHDNKSKGKLPRNTKLSQKKESLKNQFF